MQVYIPGFFRRLIWGEQRHERTLGNPLPTAEARERRLSHFATLRGGKGFQQAPKPPRTDAQGMTRRDRRLAFEASYHAKRAAERKPVNPKYLNSHARRQL